MSTYINDNTLKFFRKDYWSLDYEKKRYYQCIQKNFTDYTCKQMLYEDSFIPNSKLITIDSTVPESLDKIIIHYELQPKITIEK